MTLESGSGVDPSSGIRGVGAASKEPLLEILKSTESDLIRQVFEAALELF